MLSVGGANMLKTKARDIESMLRIRLNVHFKGVDVISFDVDVVDDELVIGVYSTGAYERRLSIRRASSMENIPTDIKKHIYTYICYLVRDNVKGSMFKSVDINKVMTIKFSL